MDDALLNILVCPETKASLSLAASSLTEKINEKINKGSLKNREGNLVKEPIDSGLVRADNQYLYPIRKDIPIMLIGDAIPLESFEVVTK